MGEGKIETTKGMCVVYITRHIMKAEDLEYEAAYRKFLSMELYKLLQDTDTRLFLETNDYLKGACDIELKDGIAGLYQYINDDTKG